MSDKTDDPIKLGTNSQQVVPNMFTTLGKQSLLTDLLQAVRFKHLSNLTIPVNFVFSVSISYHLCSFP